MKLPSMILLILVGISGCKAPQLVSKPSEFQQHVKGLKVSLKTQDSYIYDGELIAVDQDSLYMLDFNTPFHDLAAFSKNDLYHVKLSVALSSEKAKEIGIAAGVVPFLSISHGFFSIFSLPINLAVAIPTGVNAHRAVYSLHCPNDIQWDQLSKFARFPQGIPEMIDKSQLY